jgi:hypothetical protein
MSNVLVGGEALTAPLAFITISSNVDIRALSAGGDAASQARLNKLIEVVSLRGQPVILGTPTGSGPFTLVLATEHAGQWTADASGPDSLEAAIIANQRSGMGFTNAITVSISNSL